MKKNAINFSYLFILLIFTSCGNSSENASPKVTNEASDSIDIVQDTNTLEPKPDPVATVTIGDQEWMTEDINVTNYNNGDPIKEANSEKQWSNCANKKEGCYRKLKNGTIVYNGYALNDKRGIVPNGFSVPTTKEFETLFKFLGGGDSQSGKATKALATYSIFIEEWVDDPDGGGLDMVEVKSNGKSGFNAKTGGYVYDMGAVGTEGECSYWWTSTAEGKNQFAVDIGYCSQDLGGGKGSYALTYGFAVRAIKK